ncbi:type I-E CRISPR-associated protein Cas7/Cse4/CasC [Klebsiella pneumoniae]|nr:type I-E CRISPR-associated protein Cas7/Cse4/CasC [Klebsiella pneumoniae]
MSSQCWKRQVRLALPDFGIRLGVRSKNCLTAGQRLSRTGSERRTGHRMR